DRGSDLLRILWPHTVVDVLPPVAIRPAVEAAFAYRRQVIRHQVLAQLVPLVHHRPQLPRARLDRQRRRVAQAGRVGLVGTALGIDLPDQRAGDFGLHAALGDVAVGADADIQKAAVGADGQRFGP